MPGPDAPETIAAIVAAHRAGTVTPAQTIARTYQRIRDHNDPALFISLRDEKDALAEAEGLAAKDAAGLPLYGVPVAVKDNIDALGFPTTAACPAFSYTPTHDSTAVAHFARPGPSSSARPISTSSRPGWSASARPTASQNPIRDDLIPGGSSSGSAFAVGAGLVPLSLGTDTAGSGRVPAMLNNIVGLKPSLGMISTAGLVPACRTLDCISVFALTVDDALHSHCRSWPGPTRPIRSRATGRLAQSRALPSRMRLGVPRNGQLIFFGDKDGGDGLRRCIETLDVARRNAGRVRPRAVLRDGAAAL